jgi:Glycosyl hydrolases family 16
MGQGMISTTNNTVRMAAESKNNAPGGRQSIRITSKAAYNGGLIVLDLAHMPASTCGSWPAFWTVGPNWPSNGEIDIIEGVNTQQANQMTLHTSQNPYCGISGNDFSGKISSTNCYVNAAGQAANSGCAIQATADATYGDGFNDAGGGVYATHWMDTGIAVYHWTRATIPADITAGQPDPASWGKPAAQWLSTACNIGASFKNHNIVFDLTFCGAWAGEVWNQNGACKAKSGSCNDFVANNPAAFADAYWDVNSLKVYQDNGKDAPALTAQSSAPAAATTAAATTPAAAATTAAGTAAGSVIESVITITVTETTLLAIPFPQSTSSTAVAAVSGGDQLLSGILTGAAATATPTVKANAIELAETEPEYNAQEGVLEARHWRHHHHRGLHQHNH